MPNAANETRNYGDDYLWENNDNADNDAAIE